MIQKSYNPTHRLGRPNHDKLRHGEGKVSYGANLFGGKIQNN